MPLIYTHDPVFPPKPPNVAYNTPFAGTVPEGFAPYIILLFQSNSTLPLAWEVYIFII